MTADSQMPDTLDLLFQKLYDPIEQLQLDSAQILAEILFKLCPLKESQYEQLIEVLKTHPNNKVRLIITYILRDCPPSNIRTHQSMAEILKT